MFYPVLSVDNAKSGLFLLQSGYTLYEELKKTAELEAEAELETRNNNSFSTVGKLFLTFQQFEVKSNNSLNVTTANVFPTIRHIYYFFPLF